MNNFLLNEEFFKNTIYINVLQANKLIIQPSSEDLALQERIISIEKPGVFQKAKSEAMNNFSTQ